MEAVRGAGGQVHEAGGPGQAAPGRADGSTHPHPGHPHRAGGGRGGQRLQRGGSLPQQQTHRDLQLDKLLLGPELQRAAHPPLHLIRLHDETRPQVSSYCLYY